MKPIPEWMAVEYAEAWSMTNGEERCSICGGRICLPFAETATFREHCCPGCAGPKRTRDLVTALLSWIDAPEGACLDTALARMTEIRIFEAQASGVLHDRLQALPGYVCSEYLDTVRPGETDENGVRCENLEAIRFDSGRFDLVITQDVLEHVLNPDAAFQEIYRILKPGGVHLFTVPCHDGEKTCSRVIPGANGPVHLLPVVWHGDPLRAEGSLVITDFGSDLTEDLTGRGMPTRVVYRESFYVPSAIPRVDGESAAAFYESFRKSGLILDFFRYNSVVYLTRKQEGSFMEKPEWTGERFLPWTDGATLHYEHLHRYRFAAEWVGNSRVLDLGCGEGYGSHLLAETAERVVGLDIDAACVRHASGKYRRPNLSYVSGSMTDIPLSGSGRFDRVVCFEALEHIAAHDQLLKEVKRVLAPGGLFIVSTPDKKYYSDADGFDNEYHEKELYFDEFNLLLNRHFKHVALYTQYLVTGSRIRCLDAGAPDERAYAVSRGGDRFVFADETQAKAPYIVAVASDQAIDGKTAGFNSTLVDTDASLFNDLMASVNWLSEERGRQAQALETLEQDCGTLGRRLEAESEARRIAEEQTRQTETELYRVLNSRAWRWANRARRVIYSWKHLISYMDQKTG